MRITMNKYEIYYSFGGEIRYTTVWANSKDYAWRLAKENLCNCIIIGVRQIL